MSSTAVKGWVLIKCLEGHKAYWLKNRAEEHAKYEQAIRDRIRTKWWQFFAPRTFEDAIEPCSGFDPLVYRYKDSTPEMAEKDWQRKWGKIKRLADHAAKSRGDVVLDEDQSFLLTYYVP